MCRYETCKPIDVTNTLWAAASMNLTASQCTNLSTIHPRLEQSLLGWRAKELSTLLWSFGRLQHYPGDTVVDALLESTLGASNLPMHHLSNAIYGVAALLHIPQRQVLVAIEMRAVHALPKVCSPILPLH